MQSNPDSSQGGVRTHHCRARKPLSRDPQKLALEINRPLNELENLVKCKTTYWWSGIWHFCIYRRQTVRQTLETPVKSDSLVCTKQPFYDARKVAPRPVRLGEGGQSEVSSPVFSFLASMAVQFLADTKRRIERQVSSDYVCSGVSLRYSQQKLRARSCLCASHCFPTFITDEETLFKFIFILFSSSLFIMGIIWLFGKSTKHDTMMKVCVCVCGHNPIVRGRERTQC